MTSPVQIFNKKGGFTLLELLIVIGIMAILSAVAIFVLNPAETLRKSRDSQRLSDLTTVKTAIGLYLTTVTTPLLDNTVGNTRCTGGTGTRTVFYSFPSTAPGAAITDNTLDGGAIGVVVAGQVTNANSGLVDGTGWIPVNLAALTGGSPISNWPVDPINSIAALGAVASTDLVYRYACDRNDLTFEIDAQLESVSFTTGADNRLTRDGGNNPALYETGTKLIILGAGADF